MFLHCSEIEVTYRSIGPEDITIINHNLKYSCIDQVTFINNLLSNFLSFTIFFKFLN